jgi:hypothetical protein
LANWEIKMKNAGPKKGAAGNPSKKMHWPRPMRREESRITPKKHGKQAASAFSGSCKAPYSSQVREITGRRL